SWNTTGVANGSHTLTATASDAAGNTASTQITVTVSNSILDTTPPTVSISSPAAGATVSGGILLQVSATPKIGGTTGRARGGGSGGGGGDAPTISAGNPGGGGRGAPPGPAREGAGGENPSPVSFPAPVINTTADTTPPVISITSPVNGAKVSGVVSIQVSATD